MMWQAAPIFYAFMSIFTPIKPPVPLNLMSFLFVVYFLLVVFSYYSEVTTRERPVAVTVVAVTQTPSGMTVTIPSPGKDDAPPPYPGYISEFNPAYSSTDETSAPPYTATYMSNYATPPPYSQIIQQSPGTTQQSPGTTQQSQGNTSSEHSAPNSSQNSAAASPAETCREAIPLVKKSLQSNE
ncbi:mucin-7-like [Penaeus chinensis]|uniref:mucin-7-like n=1 Tax=Penaeus chinensis TaxID=139456 RepID=UPI001FB602AB|nr:mucin-7-like [Penaeus chinensis]